jgi:peptidoglycan/xylan/chitin deacetylase (PgdA/CDA1 family)
VNASPLRHALGFWKLSIDAAALEAVGAYREPNGPRARGINIWRGASAARRYRVMDHGPGFPVFACVHPIPEAPPSAEIVADILDPAGTHHSYVLWFPAEGALILPFDPDAATEAFWHEDYVPVAERTALPKPVLALYYNVAKPLMPRALKQRLRRSLAHRALASPASLDWPTDQSLDLLQRFLLRLIMLAMERQEIEFAWFWPNRHPFAVTLTHDVETAAGLARVPHVAELERVRGLRSSFNMVPHDYEVPDSLVRDLSVDGFEVGVHGYTHDGLLFSSRAVFDVRAGAIKEAARRWGSVGFRSPATYRNREWLPLLGLEYDSSYSNTAPCEPQPGGCASFFPFPLDGMTELPITLPQDHTLFELFEERGPGTWLGVLDLIRQANGMACVLAHPDPAAGYIGTPENEASYVTLLDAVAESGAWTPVPRDLARWWRSRSDAGPAEIGRLEGAASGRALLDESGALAIGPPTR